MKALRSWLVGVGLALAACGGAAGVSSNSETHFLGFCTENSCGEGLSCICGVCTVTCDPARSCGALHPDAICTIPSSGSCGDDAEPSVCDVDCDGDDACSSLGSEYRCQSGVCRLPGCIHDGQSYPIGEEFPASDGCNSCSCTEDGVLCTEIGCGSPPNTCEWDGTTYDIGEEFRTADGCNSCSCTEDGVACTTIDCSTCDYEGTIYQIGEEFPASDGCNSCSCTEDGVLCTEIGCVPPTTCEYDGTTYDIGEEFPAGDGCNSCSCTEDGVACTDIGCTTCEYDGTTYDIGEEFPATDGCNSCTCAENGGVLCTEIGCLPPTTCEYAGTTYDVGEEFAAADGCNSCSCTEDGVVCTDSACAEGCLVGDRFYEYGDSYLADDGCNTCTCSEDGSGCSQGDCSRPECLLPFEVGECDAAIPVYYYNAQTAQCEERTYGGCGGNDNNFATLEDCQSRCREFDNGD